MIKKKKNEPPKLQLQRKAKFKPFETSFEEETPQEPKSLQSIQWDLFVEPFINNPLDYVCIRESRNQFKPNLLER